MHMGVRTSQEPAARIISPAQFSPTRPEMVALTGLAIGFGVGLALLLASEISGVLATAVFLAVGLLALHRPDLCRPVGAKFRRGRSGILRPRRPSRPAAATLSTTALAAGLMRLDSRSRACGSARQTHVDADDGGG